MIEPEGWVSIDDGTRLFYSTIGNGPQVVLVLAGFYFEQEFERLTPGRTFVLLHQRGRGRSESPEGSAMGIYQEAADLETVRRALGIDTWSLIGWSYTGLVNAVHAIEHPEAVERMVHLCSLGPDQASYMDGMAEIRAKGLQRSDPDDLLRLNEMGTQGLQDTDPVAYARQFMRVVVGSQMADRSALERVSYDSCVWPNEWRRPGREEWARSFETWDERERLGSIRAPMLVVHCTEDLIPYKAQRDMAAMVPDARLLTIDGSGHWPWLERPDAFFPAIDTFLAGEWPAGAQVVSG